MGEHDRVVGRACWMARAVLRQREASTLPSGSLRVRVYVATDVLTGKPHYVGEVIKPGPHLAELAEEAKQRLVDEVQADHHAKTDASGAAHRGTPQDRRGRTDHQRRYRANPRKHIGLQIQASPAAEITAHTIEKFKAELRRCRDHCDGRPRVEHRKSRGQRKSGEHTCTARCRRHVCTPLAKATVRKFLFLISGAYQTAQL